MKMIPPKFLLLIASLLVSIGISGQEVQLAGNSLDEYPWFEYVKAFNVNADIELEIWHLSSDFCLLSSVFCLLPNPKPKRSL